MNKTAACVEVTIVEDCDRSFYATSKDLPGLHLYADAVDALIQRLPRIVNLLYADTPSDRPESHHAVKPHAANLTFRPVSAELVFG